MAEPFYKTDTDLRSGEFEDKVAMPSTGYVTYVEYLTGDPGAAPFTPEAVDSLGYVQSIPVSPQEADQWMLAHAEFKSEMDHAHEQLRIAMVRWNDEVSRWNERVAAATAAYLPVHEEIEHRKERVELERQVENERRAEVEEKTDEALREAEDAVLGPREWVFVTADPGRLAPIVHRLSCHIVRKAMEKRSSAWFRQRLGLIPIRTDEVQAKVSKSPYARWCGTCKAQKLFEQERQSDHRA